MKTIPTSRCAWWLAFAAALLGPAMAATSTLFVDGVSGGVVASWDGGDPRVPVGTPTLSAGTTRDRSPGGVTYAPLAMRVAFPPEPVVAAWINEVAAGQAPQRTVVIVDADSTGRVVEAYELSGARLTEIELPAFDAARTTLATIRLVLLGTRGRAVAPPATAAKPTTQFASAGFQFSLAGLDATGVSRIEAIRMVPPVTNEVMAAGLAGGKVPGTPPISSVILTIARAKSTSWQAWLADTINGAGATKRDGAIALLGPTMKISPVALNLYSCRIVRLSRLPDAAGVPTYYQVELACERLAFGGMPALAGAASPASEAIPAERPPIADKTGGTPTAGAAPGTGSAVAVKGDQGTRDPSLFPRVPGLVRTNFSGTFQKDYTSETASYATKDPLPDLVARVEATAKAAGWELRTLTESGSPGDQRVSQSWTKGTTSAELTFVEPRSGNGTQLTVAVMLRQGAIYLKYGRAPAPTGAARPPGETTPAERSPIATKIGKTPTAGAAPGTGSAVAINGDQGTRDPSVFPRVSGLVRTNFAGTFQKDYTSETASYATKEPLPDLVARVETTAKTAGWELRTLTESGSPGDRRVSQSWSKGANSAELTFVEPRSGNGTQLTVSAMIRQASDTYIK